MKKFFVALFVVALQAQVPTVPNTTAPVFRANLNNSLQQAVSINGHYQNPNWLTTLDWSKIINAPALGTGSVTLVTLTGTAGQIVVTGTCSGSTIVTCAVSLPSTLILPGTVNKIVLTQPATVATLTILNNKTFTVNNSITLIGTDGVSVTFPSSNATVATLGLTNSFTGRQDATGAASTAPVKSGTSLPGTCTVSDVFFKTDATAGQNIYLCTSTNTWTQVVSGGSGGGSVFTGSTSATSSFSATPTFSLADVSVKSPTRFEPGALTANVTAVTFISKTAGAKFSIAWLQDGTGGRTVAYGASASNACDVDTTASKTTTQFFEVAADGSTVKGVGCTTDNIGVEGGVESAAAGTPASGAWVCWTDSTTHIKSCKANNASTVSNMVVEKSTRTANQFLTHITSGVQTPAAIVEADLPSTAKQRSIGCAVGDPAGSALSTGVLCYIVSPVACTINAWDLLVDAGTATVATWKIATGTAIPTVSNTISTSGVAISSGTAIHSTTVTDFTSTAITANDIIGFNLSAVATAKYIYFAVQCTR